MFNCINPTMPFMSSGGKATNMSYANMPYYGVLPLMYTNFGGDLQVTTVDPYGGYKLGMLFNPLAAQTWGIPSMYADQMDQVVPTSSIQAASEAQAKQLLAGSYNNMTSAEICKASQLIQCAKTKLEAKLNDEKTTQAEKDQIQKVLKDLQEQEEKLEELKKSTDMEPNEAYKQAKEINKKLNELLMQNQKTAKENEDAGKTNTGNANKTTKSEDTGKTQKNNKAQGATTQGATQQNTAARNTGVIADGSIDNFPFEIRNTAKDFFDATDGWGTDNKKMEDILNTYTQNGELMLGLMLCWNEDQAAKNNESFIEAFIDDASHNQKKKYCEKIVNALAEEARQLGIYDDNFIAHKDAVIAAANKNVIDDEAVNKNVDAMVAILGNKFGSKFATRKK